SGAEFAAFSRSNTSLLGFKETLVKDAYPRYQLNSKSSYVNVYKLSDEELTSICRRSLRIGRQCLLKYQDPARTTIAINKNIARIIFKALLIQFVIDPEYLNLLLILHIYSSTSD